MSRELKFFQAIHEALELAMEQDPSVYVIGLGVPDPKGIFGTTIGLEKRFGSHRVMDMPTSENGMTGVVLGSALVGMRPVLVHQRLDFAILAVEQMVNQAAKWHYMFAGQSSVPMVIRLIVGRGWGQGPQHSQSLHAWFTHIPGLKVVMPATPYDAKGLLVASIEDNNPVIFIEHRWLHNTFGEVPEGFYRVPLGEARITKSGNDITIVAVSHMVVESLHASAILSEMGISAEVIDLRTLRPLDTKTILESVAKTGNLLVVDPGWKQCGLSSEIITVAIEESWTSLKNAPKRLNLSDCPIPATQSLSTLCYPQPVHIAQAACDMLGVAKTIDESAHLAQKTPLDVPDTSFSGPF